MKLDQQFWNEHISFYVDAKGFQFKTKCVHHQQGSGGKKVKDYISQQRARRRALSMPVQPVSVG